jgi:fucokinase
MLLCISFLSFNRLFLPPRPYLPQPAQLPPPGTTQTCATAVQEGNLVQLGACLNTYWEQKKRMAPGSEPSVVTQLMATLRPHVYGQTLAGAGGGGFLFAISIEAHAKAKLEALVRGTTGGGHPDVTFHDVHIDPLGLRVETSPVVEPANW